MLHLPQHATHPLAASCAGVTPTLAVSAQYTAGLAAWARRQPTPTCQPAARMPKSKRSVRVPRRACKPSSKNKARVMGAGRKSGQTRNCTSSSSSSSSSSQLVPQTTKLKAPSRKSLQKTVRKPRTNTTKKSCASKPTPTAKQACKQAVQAAGCQGRSGPAKSTQSGSLKVKRTSSKGLKCPDAMWEVWGSRWQAGPGSHVWSGSGKPNEKIARLVWLSRKKDITTGKMKAGCSVCAWFSDGKIDKTKVNDPRQKRYQTKFSRFEVSSLTQSCQIRLHAKSELHCIALRCWRQPPETQIMWVGSTDQIEVLKGNVPQPADWLKLWRQILSSGLSFRSISLLSYTDSFICAGRGNLTQITNEATANMVRIMVDVVRDGKRKDLRGAEAIALSSDDKGHLCCKK